LLAAAVLFLLTYHGGSGEFLQRHNSARNLCPAGKRISTTATIQGGAIGFRRIPSRRWSSVWNLADGRKNEQAPCMPRNFSQFSLIHAPWRDSTREKKIERDKGTLNLRANFFFENRRFVWISL
jgi:hypothetical protein